MTARQRRSHQSLLASLGFCFAMRSWAASAAAEEGVRSFVELRDTFSRENSTIIITTASIYFTHEIHFTHDIEMRNGSMISVMTAPRSPWTPTVFSGSGRSRLVTLNPFSRLSPHSIELVNGSSSRGAAVFAVDGSQLVLTSCLLRDKVAEVCRSLLFRREEM